MKTVGTREAMSDGQDAYAKPIDLTAYLDVLVRYRWTFEIAVALVVGAGIVYAIFARPISEPP